MANKRNYQKELDKRIEENQQAGRVPTLLLHSCCAPCSSYCLEYLSRFFAITIFFYNPNIHPETEFEKRVEEQKRLIREMEFRHPVGFLEGGYEPDQFYQSIKGWEHEPEGGERCFRCFELRLRAAALAARDRGFDYFTTTLTISPLKNADKLNEIGERIGTEVGIPYLSSDFKKKDGYKRSIQLSAEHRLYRQDYCGCIYSKITKSE